MIVLITLTNQVLVSKNNPEILKTTSLISFFTKVVSNAEFT